MQHQFISQISADECREYLDLKTVGRIAFVGDGAIELLPVNYVAQPDGTVFFSTRQGGVLAGLAEPTAVAFEVDHLDELNQSGWNVTLHGSTAPATEAELDALARRPRPWAPGERAIAIKVVPATLSGRRVRGSIS